MSNSQAVQHDPATNRAWWRWRRRNYYYYFPQRRGVGVLQQATDYVGAGIAAPQNVHHDLHTAGCATPSYALMVVLHSAPQAFANSPAETVPSLRPWRRKTSGTTSTSPAALHLAWLSALPFPRTRPSTGQRRRRHRHCRRPRRRPPQAGGKHTDVSFFGLSLRRTGRRRLA